MEALNREAIVALGNNILNWARPAGWPESPMAVSLSFAIHCKCVLSLPYLCYLLLGLANGKV